MSTAPSTPADREPVDPQPAAPPDAEAPTNRAERRAHARGGKRHPDLKTQDTGRHNPGPGKRQWTIRRGG